MQLQVAESVKDERLARLQAVINQQSQVFNQRAVGRTLPVLFSRQGKLAGQALGYSPWMQSVHVENGAHLSGRIAEIEIVGASMTSLTGRAATAELAISEAGA